MNGPLSPDGRSQWDGEQWVTIPPAPKQRLTAHNYFQIALVFAVVIVALGLLATTLTG